MGEKELKEKIAKLEKDLKTLAKGLTDLAQSHIKLAEGAGFLVLAQNEQQKVIDTTLQTQEKILKMLKDYKLRLLKLEKQHTKSGVKGDYIA